MPQTLKANTPVQFPVALIGIRNFISNLFFHKSFLQISGKEKSRVCQTIATGVSLAMIMPLAVILYFVIQNFV